MLPLRNKVAYSALFARYRTMPIPFQSHREVVLILRRPASLPKERKKKNDINDLQMELFNPYNQSNE